MALIRLEKLCKSYGDGKKVEVLRGVDLKITAGETIAVLGASGAGKSTMLNIMGTLDRPTSGAVMFKDKPLFELDHRGLAAFRNRFIGFVFQFHNLLPEFTALENVMLPAVIGGLAPAEAKKKAAALLAEVGLKDRLDHKPGELSGGEQQRTAMVRALIQSPELLLADEPTGNLDSRTASEVFDLLTALNKSRGTTMVVVTHNEHLASKMSRRIKMTDGSISDA